MNSKNKKILFLDAYFDPEVTAYSHLESDLIMGLIDDGFMVTVICPQPTRGVTKEQRKNYCKTETRFDGKLIIKRFKSARERHNPILRAIRYHFNNKKIFKIAKKEHDVDIIFCNSTPPTQAIFAGRLKDYFLYKQNRKVPFVYNLQDIFPDSLIHSKLAKKNSLFWKVGRKIEDKSYMYSNRIIVISDDFKTNLSRKGVLLDKIVVIPNWIDSDAVHYIPRHSNELFDEFGIDRERFVVSYSGNIGHTQNLEMLLDVAKDISLKNNKIFFAIVGDGSAKDYLQERIVKEKIDNVRIFPFQDYARISEVFSLGDVGLIASKPGIGNNSVPSKTWSFLSAERPIVCSFDLDSGLCKVVDNIKCGIISDPKDRDGLVNSILYLEKNKTVLKEMGLRGREFVTIHLNKKTCVAAYIKTINDSISELEKTL